MREEKKMKPKNPFELSMYVLANGCRMRNEHYFYFVERRRSKRIGQKNRINSMYYRYMCVCQRIRNNVQSVLCIVFVFAFGRNGFSILHRIWSSASTKLLEFNRKEFERWNMRKLVGVQPIYTSDTLQQQTDEKAQWKMFCADRSSKMRPTRQN